MAWSSPKTWSSGYVVLAADMNNIRDQLNATAPATLTAQGDIVIASGANALARLPKSTTSTQYLANTGTSNAPAWNEVALTTGVSGVLPIANGGVGVALSDPDADRILFWDDGAGVYAYLTVGSGLTLSGTDLTAPSGVKAWCDITGPGVLSSPDYNVATVGDSGTGDRDINFTTAFSSGVYAAVCTGYQIENQNQHFQMQSRTTADVQLKCYVGTSLTDLETTQMFAGNQ